MKPSFFLPVLFMACSLNLIAQSPNQARAVKATERMTKQLDLSDEQRVKVKAAYLDMFIQIADLRTGDNAPDTKERRAEIKSDFDEILEVTLTKGQNEKWQKLQEKQSGKPIRKNSASAMSKEEQIHSSAEQKTAKMTKQLGLTEAQQEKVYEAYVTQLSKATELRALAKKNKQAAVEERRKINKDCEITITNILSETQKKEKSIQDQQRKAKRKRIKSNQQKSGQHKASATLDEKADVQTDHMVKKLNLTPDQESSFRAAYMEKITALEQLSDAPSVSKKEERRIIVERYNKKLALFLNSDQLEKIQPKRRKRSLAE